MKITIIVFRTLMGALFIFASTTYLFNLITPPPTVGAMKIFNDGLAASKYIMPTIKVIELICGLCFVSGFFVPLASVVIAPIIVNIVLTHAFLDPATVAPGIFLVIANSLVAYQHRDVFAPLFKAR